MNNAQYFFVITGAYVLCHGLTTLLIVPVQSVFLPEITLFASLVYLPHGVRILATWMCGWKAILPLFVGGLLSALIFNTEEMKTVMGSRLPLAIAFGSIAGWVAFEVMKFFNLNLYSDQNNRMNWKWLLALGAIASVVNSIAVSMIYAGRFVPEFGLSILVTYAIGDTVGLFVCMLVLMFVFRWIRMASEAESVD